MRVIAASIPKSGTHLLASVLTEIGLSKRDGLGLTVLQRNRNRYAAALDLVWPFKVEIDLDDAERSTATLRCVRRLSRLGEGEFGLAHMPYSKTLENLLKAQGIRVICIVREPKAVLWSWHHHMLKFPSYPFHEEINDPSRPLEEKLLLQLTGTKKGRDVLAPLAKRYRRFIGWQKSPLALWTRFEDLIGPNGGGSQAAQVETVARIGNFLGMDIDAERIAASVFGKNSWTFRSGKVDDWQTNLPLSIIERMDHEFSDICHELGYPSA